jgi:cell fate regulator YaaT (PSP1 superfamily)
MKISDIEFQGDASKATFYYTAEERVDFRQLIKEFAKEFNIRIEMRQIGFRQEAARLGGIGSCGRELCCSTWLTDFRSVSTSAARYQQLSLNPQKLAGQCGKLKCCLNYELDSYLDALKHFPDKNVKLKTKKGNAVSQKTDIFKGMVWYAYEGEWMNWFKITTKDANEIIAENKKRESCR